MAKKETKKQQNDRKRDSVKGRLLFFAVVAGAVSGYLLYQAARVEPDRSGVESATRSASTSDAGTASPPMAWSPGETLPVVTLLSLTGERLELRVSGESHPVLLFIFSPTCSICTQNIPVWKELFDEAKNRSAEVVGISVLDSVRTSRYVEQHQLPWNVFCVAGREGFQALRVERVPMTLLVEGSGTVNEAIRGRLNDEQKEKVLSFLDADR
jgi:peroxiredoxin